MEIVIGGKKVKVNQRKGKPAKPPLVKQAAPRASSQKKEGPSTEKPKKQAKTVRFEKIRRSSSAQAHAEENFGIRDISQTQSWSGFKPIDFSAINWERRMACKADPLLDLTTYMPNVFYLDWADYQRDLIVEIEERIRFGGKKAFGCPRGGGKTGIVRGMILRATKYGMRKFAFFIGSREDKALQTLDFIRTFWYRSPLLQQDFPEIAYPVYRLEGRAGLGALSQLYRGERTYINWSTKEVQYPCMLLSREDVEGYLKHDPDSISYLPDIGINIDRYIAKSSGCMIRVAGVDGSIRGEAEIHPVLLSQPRPDFVLLDDVQKDQKADSPKACLDLERLIESAVDYLSAPDVAQACLMPCTVIREGDVSDIYLDPYQKPDWGGERHGVITKYPRGITDDLILDEIGGQPNEQGKLWNQYREIRDESLRKFGDLRAANEFYIENRSCMAEGFQVSWSERYKHDSENTNKNEVDAIQAAMNWRFKDLFSFLSEAQNKPRSRNDVTSTVLTPAEVAEKTTMIPRGEISSQWTDVVCFLDVQDELLFYAVFAFDYDFNGQFIDYGTFPEIGTNYFRKSQTAGWSLLTREYYRHNPQEKPPGVHKERTTAIRAPFEAKIYLALKLGCTHLLNKKYVVQDENQTIKQIRAIGIDTRWGQASDVVKRFVREYNNMRVISYAGHAFMPSHRQLEEYEMTPGWLFEHQMHPNVKEPAWVIRLRKDGSRYILADVNRLKSFLMQRFASPPGSKGSVTLFQGVPEAHRMFADHVAGSEYPEAHSARGMTKDCWMTRPQAKSDNDYLDCATGCMALASICGASIKTTTEVELKRPPLRDVYANRKTANR